MLKIHGKELMAILAIFLKSNPKKAVIKPHLKIEVSSDDPTLCVLTVSGLESKITGSLRLCTEVCPCRVYVDLHDFAEAIKSWKTFFIFIGIQDNEVCITDEDNCDKMLLFGVNNPVEVTWGAIETIETVYSITDNPQFCHLLDKATTFSDKDKDGLKPGMMGVWLDYSDSLSGINKTFHVVATDAHCLFHDETNVVCDKPLVDNKLFLSNYVIASLIPFLKHYTNSNILIRSYLSHGKPCIEIEATNKHDLASSNSISFRNEGHTMPNWRGIKDITVNNGLILDANEILKSLTKSQSKIQVRFDVLNGINMILYSENNDFNKSYRGEIQTKLVNLTDTDGPNLFLGIYAPDNMKRSLLAFDAIEVKALHKDFRSALKLVGDNPDKFVLIMPILPHPDHHVYVGKSETDVIHSDKEVEPETETVTA